MIDKESNFSKSQVEVNSSRLIKTKENVSWVASFEMNRKWCRLLNISIVFHHDVSLSKSQEIVAGRPDPFHVTHHQFPIQIILNRASLSTCNYETLRWSVFGICSGCLATVYANSIIRAVTFVIRNLLSSQLPSHDAVHLSNAPLRQKLVKAKMEPQTATNTTAVSSSLSLPLSSRSPCHQWCVWSHGLNFQ